MSRKLSLLFFAAAIAVITACSNFTGPNREDCDVFGDCEEPEDSSLFCGVTAGTQTNC